MTRFAPLRGWPALEDSTQVRSVDRDPTWVLGARPQQLWSRGVFDSHLGQVHDRNPLQAAVRDQSYDQPRPFVQRFVTDSSWRAASPVFDQQIVGIWEGVVQEVNEDESFFTARIVEMGTPSKEVTAEFLIDDVWTGDEGLLRPGAAFYWSVFYPTERGMRHSGRASVLRIRRLPRSISDELRKTALEKARQFLQLIKPEYVEQD